MGHASFGELPFAYLCVQSALVAKIQGKPAQARPPCAATQAARAAWAAAAAAAAATSEEESGEEVSKGSRGAWRGKHGEGGSDENKGQEQGRWARGNKHGVGLTV
eukprot:515055-Pelagomonas_calceolata.AAC.7